MTSAWLIVRWLRIPGNALLFTSGHSTVVEKICVHISITGSNFIKSSAKAVSPGVQKECSNNHAVDMQRKWVCAFHFK